MKRRFSAMLAVLVILALVMSIAAISASAVNNTPVNGPASVQFKKYLVVPGDAYIPNTVVTFAIAPGTAIAADASHMAVYAGPTGATVNTVPFAPTDTTYTTVQTGDILDSSELTGGKKYAKQTATINLSACSFTEPGVYRYNLTEVSSTDTAVGLAADPLYLDVYVTSNDAGVLAVSSTVLHNNAAAPARNATSGSGDVANAGDAVADKVDGFVNHYPTGTISIAKEVDGNQASRDKYFAVTVTLDNLVPGNKYTVDYTTGGADATIAADPNDATTVISGATTQPATLTVPDGATSITQVFYIRDGQTISILGLPMGTTYNIVENEEDYTPAVTVTGDNDDTDPTASEATIAAANNGASGDIDENDANTILVTFTGTRAGIIPTGVIMAIAPFAIGLCLFGAVIIFLIGKKRRSALYAE